MEQSTILLILSIPTIIEILILIFLITRFRKKKTSKNHILPTNSNKIARYIEEEPEEQKPKKQEENPEKKLKLSYFAKTILTSIIILLLFCFITNSDFLSFSLINMMFISIIVWALVIVYILKEVLLTKL